MSMTTRLRQDTPILLIFDLEAQKDARQKGMSRYNVVDLNEHLELMNLLVSGQSSVLKKRLVERLSKI